MKDPLSPRENVHGLNACSLKSNGRLASLKVAVDESSVFLTFSFHTTAAASRV